MLRIHGLEQKEKVIRKILAKLNPRQILMGRALDEAWHEAEHKGKMCNVFIHIEKEKKEVFHTDWWSKGAKRRNRVSNSEKRKRKVQRKWKKVRNRRTRGKGKNGVGNFPVMNKAEKKNRIRCNKVNFFNKHNCFYVGNTVTSKEQLLNYARCNFLLFPHKFFEDGVEEI